MEIVQRIEDLLKEKNIKKKKMLADLSLGINTFTNWKQRGTIPSADVLNKIADYLGVSVDYLLGNEKAAPVGAADEREATLIEFFRSLSETDKDNVLNILRTILKGE